MKKRADAFRSIGETAKMIGVPPHVLRYWETQFPQLKPMKRADGRRYYRPEDVRLAAGICEILRDDGLTIRGAKKMISHDRGESVRSRGEKRLGEMGGVETPETASTPKPHDSPQNDGARNMPEATEKPRPRKAAPPKQILPLFPELVDETKDNDADWLPNLVAFTAKLRATKRLTAAPRRKATILRDAIAGLY